MGHKGRTITIAIVTAAVLLATPSAGLGQAVGGDSSELQYPRNNVKGGALSERRPGNWLNRAAGNHIERQTTMLKAFGGAEPISEDQVEPSRREVMLLAFVEGLFEFLNDLADLFVLQLEADKLQESLQQ